jgi:hypothetical protein
MSSPMAQPLHNDDIMTTTTMTKTPHRPTTAGPACMLRWVFHHGSDTLTCAVEASDHRPSYDVCILPHWNLAEATVEHFVAPADALRRHAQIATRLRRAGWVAQYGASQ